MLQEGMAANIEQLDRCAVRMRLHQHGADMNRRAKAIEQELSKRADAGASCAELAAVLQEWDTLWSIRSSC